MFTRKRPKPGTPYDRSSSQNFSNFCFWNVLSMLYPSWKVSSGVSTSYCSIGVSLPHTRIVGLIPDVRCRSDPCAATTSLSRSSMCILHPLLHEHDAQHLFERRHPVEHFGDPILLERPHPRRDPRPLDHVRGHFFHHQGAHVIIHHHDLEQPNPPLVPNVVARLAPLRPIQRRRRLVRSRQPVPRDHLGRRHVRLAAPRAQHPNQPLRHHPDHRRRHQERLDPPLHPPPHPPRRA